MEFENRVALTLGGGSVHAGLSIGKAISIAYAREGAMAVVADLDLDSAEKTACVIRESGGRAVAMQVDVTRDSEIETLCSRVLEDHGRIDILHCNVGLGKSGDSAQTTPQDWRHISDANLTALHVATQAVLPSMRARESGVILITSSIAGVRYIGYPHLAYGATKAAAIHFARLVALENAAYGIRANAIVAGLIDTPRIRTTLAKAYPNSGYEEMRATRDAQCPTGRMGTATDIANAAVFLASDKARYITGTELVVDGGLSLTTR
jgi:NAD(P)-dependent dehydrogenase (short-subunit alcohol dehydrogenase family)